LLRPKLRWVLAMTGDLWLIGDGDKDCFVVPPRNDSGFMSGWELGQRIASSPLRGVLAMTIDLR